jgi:hypothetical protein
MKIRPLTYWRWREGMKLLSSSSLFLQALQLEAVLVLMEAKCSCRLAMECNLFPLQLTADRI